MSDIARPEGRGPGLTHGDLSTGLTDARHTAADGRAHAARPARGA